MEKIKVDQQQIDNVMLAIKTIATGFSSMIGIVFGALLAIVGLIRIRKWGFGIIVLV